MTLPAFFRFSRKERIASFLILAMLTAITLLKQFRQPASQGREESLALRLFKATLPAEDSSSAYFLSGEPAGRRWYNDSAVFAVESRGNYPYTSPERSSRYSEGILSEKEGKGSPEEVGGEAHNKWRKKWDIVELNTADSAALEALPGIGPGSAAAIIRYRGRLGGFRSVNQLSEIKAIRTENLQTVLPYLYADTSRLTRFCLNSCTMEELRRHPYISYKVANAITAVREQHGDYRSVADIKKSVLVNDSIYERIRDYFSLCQPNH